MVKIKLLRFGILSELIDPGLEEIEFEQNLSVGDFKAAILDLFPELQAYPQFSIAVNETYAHADQIIADGDILALIPPVAGG